jgi:EAL domain-containing protein (putative c-di-GMP-specific phosphodiesterase class I)/GGDEF domain-containing protein
MIDFESENVIPFSTEEETKPFPSDSKLGDLAFVALDSVKDYVFISDSFSKNIIYMNKALREALPLKEGVPLRCYTLFRNKSTPCKNCRNHSCFGHGFNITHNSLTLADKTYILKSTQFNKDNRHYTISVAQYVENNSPLCPKIEMNEDQNLVISNILKSLLKNNDSPNLQIFSALSFIGQLSGADSVSLYEERQVDSQVSEKYQRSAFWSSRRDDDISNSQNLNLPDKFVANAFTYQCAGLYKSSDFNEDEELKSQLNDLSIERVYAFPVIHHYKTLGVLFLRNLDESEFDKNQSVMDFILNFITLMLYSKLQTIELDKTRHIDEMTGFKNRNALTFDLKSFTLLKNIGVFVVNINGLQRINQTHGFKQGDNVIIQTGQLISELMQISNIYRTSGDEFMAIYPDISEYLFNQKMDVLVAFLSNKHSFSCAIGFAYTKDGHKLLETMKSAENSMINNKKRYYIEHPVNNLYANKDEYVLDIMSPSYIQKLIDNQNFMVYYQPKINLETGVLAGAEALIRLSINNKLVSPDDFIPAMDASHFTYIVDFFVLEKVCRTIRHRLTNNQAVRPVSCNFSRHTFVMPDFSSRLIKVLNHYHVPFEMITLEISEQSSTTYHKELIETCESLYKKGFKISIDDFGVAHANVWDLASLKISEVKFDKKLIDSLLLSDNSKIVTILDMLITMCNMMQIKTVAEGVEKDLQKELLKKLGCNELQGYLFSRPVDEKTYYEML